MYSLVFMKNKFWTYFKCAAFKNDVLWSVVNEYKGKVSKYVCKLYKYISITLQLNLASLKTIILKICILY